MVLFDGEVPRDDVAVCSKDKGQPKDEQGLDSSACTLVMLDNGSRTASNSLVWSYFDMHDQPAHLSLKSAV